MDPIMLLMTNTDKQKTTFDQIAAEAWGKIKAYDGGIVGKQSPRIDDACIAIIKAYVEKATKAPTGRTWQEDPAHASKT